MAKEYKYNRVTLIEAPETGRCEGCHFDKRNEDIDCLPLRIKFKILGGCSFRHIIYIKKPKP